MDSRFLAPMRRYRGSGGDTRIVRDRFAAVSNALDASRRPEAFVTARQAVSIYDGGMMPTSGNKYFCAYPVAYTGVECEACPDAGTVDTTTSMFVFVLGTVAPAVGDVLIALAVGNRWVAQKGLGGGGGGIICAPCAIPKNNLTCNWVNPLAGNGSAPMLYTPAPPSWTSGCVNGLQFVLACTGGQVEFQVIYWVTGACTGPPGITQYCSNLRPAPLALIEGPHTCSPFSFTFTLTEAGCPTILAGGYESFTITSP